MSHLPTNIRIKVFALLDGLIILLVAGGIGASLPLMKSAMPETVAIFRDSALLARYPVGEDRLIQVDGATGPMTVKIDGKSARITESHCPKQVCMHAGVIRKAGEQIVCAPNHVMVAVEGPTDDTKGVDGVVR